METKVLDILKKFNVYGLSVPSLLALLPIIVTATILIRVTYGDTQQALYILTELGLIQIWTQGAGSLLITAIPQILALGFIYLFKSTLKQRSLLLFVCLIILMIPTLFISSVAHILTAILLVYVSDPLIDGAIEKRYQAIKSGIDKSRKELHVLEAEDPNNSSYEERVNQLKKQIEKLEKPISKSKTRRNALLLLVTLIVLMIVIFSYPSLPQTNLSTDRNDVKGLVMKRGEGRVMFYNYDSQKIEIIHESAIKSESVCARSVSSFSGLSWSPMRHLLEHANAPTVPYETCPPR